MELRLLFGEMRTGRLIGRVLGGRTHRPVATAAVSVAEREEAVETNRRGHFILSGLPVGEYELSVRHLGYAPISYPVSVNRGLTTEVEIDLTPDLDGNIAIRGSKERWSLTSGVTPDAQLRESINDLVLPTEIAGIEVYTGAAALPAEFGGHDARCGAVVIWTK
ncbi:carboxypeptidase regulatory-like domain-containing protein [Candidatus Palauibacter sp.]|uniref:carboxypeptidase regulatory-like domain-containing protein n=1 Tax=Candidatus Palauibacter sp. TaxID=3101350 RepID=UPI003C6F5012